MPRRRRPNYYRSLVSLLPGIAVGGAALFIKSLDDVRCSMVPATIACPEMIPVWGYFMALAVVVSSIAWTCWAWYKDHVHGDYQLDVMTGVDRYRD